MLSGTGQAGQKAFRLLLEALNISARVGIGKFSLRENEQTSLRQHVLLRPFGRALALEILFYPDEIRLSNEITEPDSPEKNQTNPKEPAPALQLVESQSEPFRPEQYDHYQAALELVIEQKIQGQEVVIPPSPQPRIHDLKAALQKLPAETRIRNEPEKQKTPT